jgi:ribonucleoside-diphosphate reductase alpha chain
MSPYQQFIYTTRYSRWLWDHNRRETWTETVARYADYITQKVGQPEVRDLIFNSIYNMEVMPSMRALMTAGPALDVSNVAGFNCSYLVIDDLRAFDELLYILMNGTGVGFSVERRYVNQLPKVPALLFQGLEPIVVEDSKIGWAEAIRDLIDDIFNKGTIRTLDTHKVRLAGEPLKTFGGRASGPEPLIEVAEFIVNIAKRAAGRQLTSLECHDIVCKIAACVVVGGVRRSALISLSDLDDEEMRDAKSGEWWIDNSQRALANNSAVYEGDIDRLKFDAEWAALVASGSGERGIFNRTAAQQQAARMGRDPNIAYGTNPCGEILLRPNEFCNLTEVVARAEDTREDFFQKVEVATIMGTFQSTLTNFAYLRPIWKINSEEERLLGVSITGIFDAPQLHDAALLNELREHSHAVNIYWADLLGIEHSASMTCVKPSGTVSQLVDSASGLHARHARYYIRRVRNDSKDPVSQFLANETTLNVEVDAYNPSAVVFAFPIKSPEGAMLREEVDPIRHLEVWSLIREHWCDHNPSVTVNVKPDEWDKVGDWVFENFSNVCGLSFLPYAAEDSTYVQLPYEEVDEAAYLELLATMPEEIDWSKLYLYEDGGASITAGRELACVGNSCEIVGLN